MGLFKKPPAQINSDSDEEIRRQIRARVAKQVGIYDEDYINTGKIGGTKSGDTPEEAKEENPVTSDAETSDVDVAEPAAVKDIEAPEPAAVEVFAEVLAEPEPAAVDVVEAPEPAAVAVVAAEPAPVKDTEKPVKQATPAKSEEIKTSQMELKPVQGPKPKKEPKPVKEPKPKKEPKPAKEPKSPKDKKQRKKKKTNIALILFIVVLILAFIPLYYFLTGGNLEGPELKVSSPDNTLLLTEPLLIRGMVSDSNNMDGVKVFYSLDSGSASLLYTFEAGAGPFEQEIDLPDTADFYGDHSVTVYAENPNGELSKDIVLNFEVVEPELTSIEITTPPAKTKYVEGELLDLTGLLVSASYEDGTAAPISDYIADLPTGTRLSKAGEIPVTISFEERNVTKTITFSVSVQMAAVEMPSKKENGIYTVPAFVQ